jgi:hypothetical protein
MDIGPGIHLKVLGEDLSIGGSGDRRTVQGVVWSSSENNFTPLPCWKRESIEGRSLPTTEIFPSPTTHNIQNGPAAVASAGPFCVFAVI